MHATVTTWCLDESVQPPEQRDQLIRKLLTSGGIDLVRRAGVIDLLAIAIAPDALMFVSIYETEAEAVASGRPVLDYVAQHFDGVLQLVSRVSGEAFDLPDVGSLSRPQAQEWREGATVMHANVATWKLAPPLHSRDALVAYLQAGMHRYFLLFERLGLLDFIIMQPADDTILVINLHVDQAEGDAAYEEAILALRDAMAGKVELVTLQKGQAFDVPQMLGE